MNNDIFFKENFLSDDDFMAFNKLMLSRYPRVKALDWRNRKEGYPVPFRTQEMAKTEEQISLILGVHVNKVVKLIEQALYTDFGFSKVEFGSAWYAYMPPGTRVKTHVDGTVGSIPHVPEENCYSLGLYTHTVWEEDWGGEWSSEQGDYAATPNLLLGWNRTIPHQVKVTNQPDENMLRMVLITSWGLER